MQRKVHGRADPQRPNSGCLPLLSRDGYPMNLHSPLQGGVGRPVADFVLLTSTGGRVRQTRFSRFSLVVSSQSSGD